MLITSNNINKYITYDCNCNNTKFGKKFEIQILEVQNFSSNQTIIITEKIFQHFETL